jgi:hypothetical protein
MQATYDSPDVAAALRRAEAAYGGHEEHARRHPTAEPGART